LQASPGKLFEAEERIEVRAEVARAPGGEPVLQIDLKNAGTASLKIPPGSLPWNRPAMAIALVAAGDGRALDEIAPAGEAAVGAEPTVIEAGASLSGQIPIGKNYPKLGSALKTGDVVLFWSYQLTTAEKTALPRTGGWITIPREK
jgi:hypothetical protein